jgi:hypothetical protein
MSICTPSNGAYTTLTLTAHTLYSGILEMGSSAAIVNSFADASGKWNTHPAESPIHARPHAASSAHALACTVHPSSILGLTRQGFEYIPIILCPAVISSMPVAPTY